MESRFLRHGMTHQTSLVANKRHRNIELLGKRHHSGKHPTARKCNCDPFRLGGCDRLFHPWRHREPMVDERAVQVDGDELIVGARVHTNSPRTMSMLA